MGRPSLHFVKITLQPAAWVGRTSTGLMLPRAPKVSLRTEVRHVDDEGISLPVATRVAIPLADVGRQVRAPVHDDVPLPPLALTQVVEHRDATRCLHDPPEADACNSGSPPVTQRTPNPASSGPSWRFMSNTGPVPAANTIRRPRRGAQSLPRATTPRNPPNKPLHDPAGDRTFEPPQPLSRGASGTGALARSGRFGRPLGAPTGLGGVRFQEQRREGRVALVHLARS